MSKRFFLHLSAILFLAVWCIDMYAAVNSLAPTAGKRVFVELGSKGADAPIYVINYGERNVESFEYTLAFDGRVMATETVTLQQPILRMDSRKMIIPIPSHATLSETELTFTITKVNGQPNEAGTNYTNIPRITVTKAAKRRVVVEEYTGMWCGYCPKGIVVIEHLAKTYPDDFIGIAVHGGRSYEPLLCRAYIKTANKEAKGYPTIRMNRKKGIYDYKGDNDLADEKNYGTEADVDVSAVWDAKKNDISVTCMTTFRINKPEAPYAIAFVLTEDGMKNASWAQANYISGNRSYAGISEELDWFVNAPSYIYGLENNHVAITAAGVDKGIEGSITAPIEADKPQTYRHVFSNIAQYRVVQDKSKMHVCALLINTKNGEIVNAAKCSIAEGPVTGIENVRTNRTNAVETARYTIDGRRISAPVKGINIVKYSDGRTVKTVVK